MSQALSETPAVGALLREWRERRRLSQLSLALDAGISTRHLSFVETGRARPSREMLLQLADQLDVPLRARNALLLSAGYAPAYAERTLDDPALAGARRAIDLILSGHEPFPALVVDRGWRLVAANRALGPLLAGVDSMLLTPPVNVMRLALHPEGLAPRIANLAEWRAHLLERLRAQIVPRAWRREIARRIGPKLSLELDAGISKLHLRFVHTARESPNHEKIQKLANKLNLT